ncbi:EAL domain-containing protein [Cellulomonas sp. S1-8]|uniref:sensor domain-containing phosphodiesterase n=1 Tax=Cellulomonas sp. S1-8 TaxID=2904790 RepID=UPI00224333A2|nr:EAL domain-containing protein [Cellulomonas sp. S1-8]UZN02034.1 EAL domain-containing protein [Cellulomonas sp. S1-8]
MDPGTTTRRSTAATGQSTWGEPPPGVRQHPMEQDRLDSLRSYGVLDSPSDDAYDAVVALAAHVCGTPMAAVTLIDADRQWFKSSLGLAVTETPRDQSFCSHVVADDAVLLVPDARADARFSSNPNVTSHPRIRSYLGVPLVGRDGLPLGALAVLDRRVRRFGARQVAILRALGTQVVALLEQDRRDRTGGSLQPHVLQESRDPGRLRRALEDGELVPSYQPVVDMLSGRPHHVEALLRWQHPALGTLLPLSFMPALESTSLVIPVGRSVLDAACAQLAALDRVGLTLPGGVAVNVSGGHLARPGLARDVLVALERHDVVGSRLCLELTESTDLPDHDVACRELDAVAALGVHVVVDDFGVGWSNLSRVLELPVDGLKIDRGIAAAVLVDPRAAAVVTATVGLAHALSLTVTAEGVEHADVRDHLRDAGCDLAQGWLYGPAVPPLDLPDLLRRLGGPPTAPRARSTPDVDLGARS